MDRADVDSPRKGVKGGKWFSLIDKVHPERTLRAAFSQVAANEGAAGVDHVTIAMFESHLDEELKRLSDQLRTGTTARRRSADTTSPNRGRRKSGRWEFRRSEIGWFKRHCVW